MSYLLTIPEKDCLGKSKFTNDKHNTECAVFVQKAAKAPATPSWRPGLKVSEAKPGQIPRGTAIATFDDNGRYPVDVLGKHAAIYLSHTTQGIVVLDQWNDQGEVLQRVIHFNKPKGTRRSNDADTFYVIE